LKSLIARRACSASPSDAWYALRGFDWSVEPDDVAAADAGELAGDPGFLAGRPTAMLLFDHRHLRARLVVSEFERRMTVSVDWRRVVRAYLVYEVLAAEAGCELVHARFYRGLVTRYLASVWRAREEEEQAELLRDWCWEAGTIAAQRRWAS
jgi:hypothetical protein